MAGGPVCAWAPGNCKSWCRSNAVSLVAPTVLDIMDEVNRGTFSGIGYHFDLLSPDILRCIVSEAAMDSHVADMHVETAESIGLDGIFGLGNVLGERRKDVAPGTTRCRVKVSGLWKCPRTPGSDVPTDDVLEKWDSWDCVDGNREGNGLSPWQVKTLVVEQNAAAGPYTISRIDAPVSDASQEQQFKQTVSRDGAVSAVGKTLADDIETVRMVASRLFFDIESQTHPWPYGKRAAMGAVLDVLARHAPEIVAAREERCPGHVKKWIFKPMGPRATPCGGNIHVSLKRSAGARPPESISWNSCASCEFSIDVDPRKDFSPIGIRAITAW